MPEAPVPNQIIITFKPDTLIAEREAYIQRLGGQVIQRIDALNTVILQVPPGTSTTLSATLSDGVTASEPDYYVSALVAVPPSDPFYNEQWALPVINAPAAWLHLPSDAPNVVVAVIDSGVCLNHPDLQGRLLPGWDFVQNDSQPQDDYGHGCGVAGIIAANGDNGIGIAGVAPNALVLPLRVLNAQGLGTYSDVAAAMVYAVDHGAQVINLSLGGTVQSGLLENAVTYAVEHDVMVIAAAGNSGSAQVLYPAAYAPVIAVGSIDQNLSVSSFSNGGTNVDFLAPGRNILSSKLDGSYGTMTGTSFAAPQVAGVAAVEISLGNALSASNGIIHIDAPAPDSPVEPTVPPTSTTPEYAPTNDNFDPSSVTPRSRPSTSAKLTSSLIDLATLWTTSTAQALAQGEMSGLEITGQRVAVTFTTTDTAAASTIKAQVVALGGEITAEYDRWFDALVPVTSLEPAGLVAGVGVVEPSQRMFPSDQREPITPSPNDEISAQAGLILTQGVAASNADDWQAVGYDGTGVTVAVIDSGFANYLGLQAAGELPPAGRLTTLGVIIESCPDESGIERCQHGSAVAEIVYDMAPGINMILISPQSPVELANRITELANYPAATRPKVITSSVGYSNLQPGDGTGMIADAIEYAVSQGVLFTQAAGNAAYRNWQNTFTDTNGNRYLEFDAGGDEMNELGLDFDAGDEMTVYLRWNAWPTTDQDYNLHLYHFEFGGFWIEVASGTNNQAGSILPPVEYVNYVVPAGGEGFYAISVEKVSATGAQVIDLIMHTGGFQVSMADRSLIDFATSTNVFAVAALDVNSPTYALEAYSSRGQALGPGGSLAPGNNQPRIASFDEVATESYRPYYFWGTSAATPHVAGAAALVWEAYPSFTVAQVKSFLEGRAIDMGAAGYDVIYGAGRLNLGTPPPVCPTFPYTVPAGDTAALIFAIECANNTVANDVINLTNSTYTLTDVNYIDPLGDPNGLPVIVDASVAGTLTINGNGATIARSSADGTPEFRLFFINNGANLTLSNLVLTGGLIYNASGGAIFNGGTLLLTQVRVSNNSAYGGGAVGNYTGTLTIISSELSANTVQGIGGALVNAEGTLHLINSTISGNSVTETDDEGIGNGGGGLFMYAGGSALIVNSTITNNTAADTTRSGIWQVDGTLTVQNSIVANNQIDNNCQLDGGAYFDNGNNLDNGASCGFSGEVGQFTDPMLYDLAFNGGSTQTHALQAGSLALNAGENALALDQNDVPLTTDQRGAGFPRIRFGTVDIGAYEEKCPSFPYTVPAGDTAELITAIKCANSNGVGTDDVINLTNSTYTLTSIYSNDTGLPEIVDAAAVGTLTINGNGATIARSSAGSTPEFRLFHVLDGALRGNLTLNNLTLGGGKLTLLGGGAILNNGAVLLSQVRLVNNSAGSGGAVNNDTGRLTILSSEISGNSAWNNGGALVNFGGTLKLINSTVSGNTVTASNVNNGGGALIIFGDDPDTFIINSTISNNTAANAARSGIWQLEYELTIQNSIIANNNGANNCAFTGGTFIDGGNNLDNGTSCGFSGAVGQNTNPLLGALSFNGGPTRTRALLSGSPAINAGNNALAVDQNGAPLTTDQRGGSFQRIRIGKVDIGALEVQSCSITFPHTVPAGNAADLSLSIACANSNGPGTHDVITLTPGTYTLTAVNNSTGGTGNNGLPAIVDVAAGGMLTINGNGATIARSQLGSTPEFRLFEVLPGANLTLNSLTLGVGKLTSGAGGAIMNQGTTLLSYVRLVNNSAVGGGAVLNDGGTLTILSSELSGNTGVSIGGALFNYEGTLKLINSTLSGNNVTFSGSIHGGGALYSGGTATTDTLIVNSTITNNTAAEAARSGIWHNLGTLTIQNTIVANNNGANNCAKTGGTFVDGGNNLDNGTSCGFGGAVGQNTNPLLGTLQFNGGFTRTRALQANSNAINAGSNAKAVDQNGAALTLDQRGAGYPRVLLGTVDIGAYEATCPGFPYNVPAGDVATLINAINCANSASTNDVINLTNSTYTLTAVNNTGIAFGGDNGLPAIASAASSGTLTINGNGATIRRSPAGGTPQFRLFELIPGANLTLDRLTLTGGLVSSSYGGGILVNAATLTLTNSTVNGSWAVLGGGIFQYGATITVVNSTLSNNLAANLGGGIASDANSTLKLINSTLSGNTVIASAGSNGGGALDMKNGTAQIINSTITSNTAGNAIASGIWQEGGTLTIQNSIVANNNGANNCRKTGGTFTDGGNNLDNGTSCGFTGAVGQNTNPVLGALANNGGPTQTHALQMGSPAYNAGNNAKAVDQNGVALTTDQRGAGFQRVLFGTVDIGAFESDFVALDPIFSNSFESANLTGWTSNVNDGGDLSVTPAAALMGGFGMQAVIDDTTAIYVTDDSPNLEARYRARFLFDPNSVVMASGDNFSFFFGFQGTSTGIVQAQLRRSGGAYQVRVGAMDDNSNWFYSPFVTITDEPHLVELYWLAATVSGSNNGKLDWWLDEAAQTAITALDTDASRVDRVRLGGVSGIDAGTSGTVFFDAFISRRLTYIGRLIAAPVLVSPPDASFVTREVSPSLKWNTVAAATQYYAEFSNGTTVNLNSGWIAGTTWAPGIQPQGVYTWRVKTRNASGEESAWSVTRTLTVRPGVPTNLQGTVLGATWVSLTWTASIDAPADITGYRIYRAGVQIANVASGVTSFTDNNAVSCAANQYKVRSVNGSITSLDSNVITVNTLCDPIFSDGFEAINLNAWSLAVTDGTNLATIPGAQLTGSARGLRALINDANPLYVGDDTPNLEVRYRVRFYFDPNNITMANNDSFVLFYGMQGTSTAVLQLPIRRSGSTYQLRVGALDDSGTFVFSPYVTISNAPHIVELDWQAASAAGANNGSLTLWVDEVQATPVTGIDNDTRRIDRARLGAVGGIDAGTTGTVYFDAFRSGRVNYIGAEVGGLGDVIEPEPTETPTAEVTPEVTDEPTVEPTAEITPEATDEPTVEPTAEITPEATGEPTIEPTAVPTEEPTAVPTPTPTPEPTLLPFSVPVFQTMDDGAPLWTASAGWQLSAEAAYSGLGWGALASGQVETLALNVPVNLAGAAVPTFSFQSKLVSGALPEVRASLDGVNWQTVAVVTPSLNWALVQVDLSAYAGQTIRLQFVWASPAGVSDSWQVDEVTIADGAVVPPPVEPTATATPVAPGSEPTMDAPTVAPRDGAMPDAPADLPQPPTG